MNSHQYLQFGSNTTEFNFVPYLSVLVSPFSDGEKPGPHYPQHIYSFDQSTYRYTISRIHHCLSPIPTWMSCHFIGLFHLTSGHHCHCPCPCPGTHFSPNGSSESGTRSPPPPMSPSPPSPQLTAPPRECSSPAQTPILHTSHGEAGRPQQRVHVTPTPLAQKSKEFSAVWHPNAKETFERRGLTLFKLHCRGDCNSACA